MKAKEFNRKLREILEREDIRFKLRYVKSKSYGECHGHFIALYGDFVTESSIDEGHLLKWENDNLWYSDERDEIIAKLRKAGLNVFDALLNKYEILVEVSVYYYGHSEVKNYDFRTSFSKDDLSYRHYKITKTY